MTAHSQLALLQLKQSHKLTCKQILAKSSMQNKTQRQYKTAALYSSDKYDERYQKAFKTTNNHINRFTLLRETEDVMSECS